MKKIVFSATTTKWLKSFHIFLSCAWGGGASSIFAIHCLFNADSGSELYARNMALIYVDNFVIIPSAIGCFVTGVLYGQFTKWGYIKYYWIITKWIILISLLGAGGLLFVPWLNRMAELSNTVRRYVEVDPTYHAAMDIHVVMAAAQIVLVFFLVIISVFKPWGRTNSR